MPSKGSKLLVPLLVVISVLLLGLAVLGVIFLMKFRQGSARAEEIQDESLVLSSPAPLGEYDVPGDYPQGSTRYLSESDLYGMSLWELKVMRNEIYARHHYIFKSSDLIEHFDSEPWYIGYDTDAKAVARTFSDIERENVSLIKNYEKMLKNR